MTFFFFFFLVWAILWFSESLFLECQVLCLCLLFINGFVSKGFGFVFR